MGARRPEFRPDIEGLRGVAILLVVLFHAGITRLAGGFVGVDVFFVLSGYFITGLLVRELTQTGDVDLTEFYGRRALRLVPALLVVLAVTLAAVMWLYAPIDRAPIARSARAVALSAGNIEFASGAVDYFSTAENPLLHTWSLGVEEQFYLVWPLLVLFVVLVHQRQMDAARTRGDRIPPRPLLTWIALAGVLSFGASLWLTYTTQPWAFFGMPTRIWEFALGGALAVRLGDDEERRDGRGVLLQIAGLLAIGYGVATYDRSTHYPGVAALLPALGACALLVGGQLAPDGIVSRVLSWMPLRWLGRLSFAWYLWHWPLVGIGAVIDPEIGMGGRLAWSAAALALAWLTLRFIEEPARQGRLSRMPMHRISALALAASVAMALLAHVAMLAAEKRAAQPDQRAFAAARVDRMDHGCWATTVEEHKGPCEFGDTRSSTTVVLFGDSHAEHWLGGLDRIGRERGWKIVAMVKGGCPVAEMPEVNRGRLQRYYRECTRYRQAMLQRVVAMRPAAVILSSWDHYMPTDGTGSEWQVTPESWRRGLRRTYSRLASAGVSTVVIRDVPRTWFDVPGCLSRRAAKLPLARACVYERDRSISRVAIAAQDAAARGLPIHLIDMNDRICATPRCEVVRGGVVVFTDDNHLTASFSRMVAPVLAQRLAPFVEGGRAGSRGGSRAEPLRRARAATLRDW
jgi:peptidoglycan/LPS O-acetylase OafA/YrhL